MDPKLTPTLTRRQFLDACFEASSNLNVQTAGGDNVISARELGHAEGMMTVLLAGLIPFAEPADVQVEVTPHTGTDWVDVSMQFGKHRMSWSCNFGELGIDVSESDQGDGSVLQLTNADELKS